MSAARTAFLFVILRCEPEGRASKDERPGPSPFEGRAARGHLRVTERVCT